MFAPIKKMLLTAAVFAALAPAGASAMINRESSAGTGQSALPVEAVTPTSQSGDFQWGDAGIGAAGMLVIVAAGGGLVMNARRRSHRRSLVAS